jgi:hypothetical protein
VKARSKSFNLRAKPLSTLAFVALAAACSDVGQDAAPVPEVGPVEDADPCQVDPCLHGGSCSSEGGVVSCACPSGFSGERCEIEPDECADQPCANGAVCVDQNDGFACICAAGFSGPTCSDNIDDCSPNPCANGGTCSDGLHGYSCACPTGFEGDSCELDIDECAADPCENGGTCVNEPGSHQCLCPWPSLDPTCACAPGGPVSEWNFFGQGSRVLTSHADGALTITGSGSLNVVNDAGLGVLGGHGDIWIDGSEWVRFQFDRPGFVTLFECGGWNVDMDNFIAEATVEAWDPRGVSLGTVDIADIGSRNINAMFGDALVSAVKLKARTDGVIVCNVSLDPCE